MSTSMKSSWNRRMLAKTHWWKQGTGEERGNCSRSNLNHLCPITDFPKDGKIGNWEIGNWSRKLGKSEIGVSSSWSFSCTVEFSRYCWDSINENFCAEKFVNRKRRHAKFHFNQKRNIESLNERKSLLLVARKRRSLKKSKGQKNHRSIKFN